MYTRALRKIFICNQSNLFPTKGYSSWFRTQNSVHLNQKENPFYSRSACVKKKPFDTKRVYSSMFLLKKKWITSANYCLITNHDFFTIYIVRALDNMLNVWKKPKKEMLYEVSSEVQSPGIELSPSDWEADALATWLSEPLIENRKKRNIHYFHFLLRQKESHFGQRTWSISTWIWLLSQRKPFYSKIKSFPSKQSFFLIQD